MLGGRVRQKELSLTELLAKGRAPFHAEALDFAVLPDGEGKDQRSDQNPGDEMPIPRRYEAEGVPRPMGARPQQERDRGHAPLLDHHVAIGVAPRAQHPGGDAGLEPLVEEEDFEAGDNDREPDGEGDVEAGGHWVARGMRVNVQIILNIQILLVKSRRSRYPPSMPRHRSREGPGAPPLTPGVAEIRALAHPLRLRLMELFAEAPRTTKQVADLLGEPPTRLYHHVAALERAGLLHLKETRQNRGTTEKWYEATNWSMGWSGVRPAGPKNRPKGESAARRALAMSVLTQTRQEMVEAMAIRGRERPMLGRIVVVAPAAQLSVLRRRLFNMLKEIREEFEGEDPNLGAAAEVERWALTLTFAPVSASPRRP